MGKYGKLFYLKNKMGTLISEINKLLIAKGKNEIFLHPMMAKRHGLIAGGNRVQHALRAYTPREQSVVKAAAEHFRQNPELDIVQVLTKLKTDETLISFLDQEGRPLNC